MKIKSTAKPNRITSPSPSDQEISDYAFHLYEQGNCEHGHDLAHWQEATARLKASRPRRTTSA